MVQIPSPQPKRKAPHPRGAFIFMCGGAVNEPLVRPEQRVGNAVGGKSHPRNHKTKGQQKCWPFYLDIALRVFNFCE